MFPILALCAVLSSVTVSKLGDLKDSDRVITSADGFSAVTNRIEDRLVPGPGGSLYADRTVKADLSVTDVPYYEYDIPIVSTNYDTTLVPVTEIVGYERLNAPSAMYVKYSTAPGETTLGWVGSSTMLQWYAQSYPSAGKVNGVETLTALQFQGQPFQVNLTYWKTSTGREQTTLGGSGRSQDAVVLEDAFIRAVRNRGETVSVSNIRPYPSGSAVGITVRCGSGDASPARTMFEIPIYVTNGWTVVTNSMSIVTNGFDHVTNAAPPVVTALVTEGSLTNAFDKFSKIDVRLGEVRPVFTNSSVGVIFDVSVDSEALAPSVGVRSPVSIRIPELQSVIVGGSTNASGRYVGGKTLYSEIGDVAGDEIRRSVSVEAAEPVTTYSRKLATISVPSGETDLYVPEFCKAGSPLKFIGDDLGVYVADLTNTMWDAYTSCNGSVMRRTGRFYLTSVTQPSGIVSGKITWTLDMSTWDGETAVFPFSRARNQDGRVVWDSPVEADRILDSEHPLQIWFLFSGTNTNVSWYLVSGIVNPSVAVPDEQLVIRWDSALPEFSRESFFLSKDYPDVGGRVELHRVFPDGSAIRSHGLVPDSRKINGQPLTNDITITAMPATGLVWDVKTGKIRTADGEWTLVPRDGEFTFVATTNINSEAAQ